MKTLKLAWKNILHRPLNLLLSTILFGLGIGLINFLILFNTQLKNKFDKNLADIDLVIGAKGSPLQMILSSMYHIDNPTGNIAINECKAFLNPKHPLIKSATPLSLGDSYKSYRIVGTTDSIFSYYNAELIQGKIHQNNFEVTLGKAVADETGLTVGSKFVSSHGFNDDEDLAHDHAAFVVTGILKGNGSVIDQLIITNLSTVWNVHDHTEEEEEEEEEENHDSHDHSDHDDHDHSGHDHDTHNHEGHDHDNHNHDHDDHNDHEAHDHDHDVAHTLPYARTNQDLLNYPDKEITSLLIKFKNRKNFQSLNMPRSINENTDMQAASPAIEINRLYLMIGNGRKMLQALAILIAIISAISIFIVLYKSMKERKYELALIRVMGGSRGSIFSLITIEGVLLTTIGFVVGYFLSHFGLQLLANSLKSSYKYSFTGYVAQKEELYVLAISIMIGILAAIIPAIQAANTDIHKTLTNK